MRVALLDVNVLLALGWPNHQHHFEATDWFESEGKNGWATCALTEAGFIRLSSNSSYTSAAVLPKDAAKLLSDLKKAGRHSFWHSPTASDPEIFRKALACQQVMDAYLVKTAVKNKGRFVTIDAGVSAHETEKGTVTILKT